METQPKESITERTPRADTEEKTTPHNEQRHTQEEEEDYEEDYEEEEEGCEEEEEGCDDSEERREDARQLADAIRMMRDEERDERERREEAIREEERRMEEREKQWMERAVREGDRRTLEEVAFSEKYNTVARENVAKEEKEKLAALEKAVMKRRERREEERKLEEAVERSEVGVKVATELEIDPECSMAVAILRYNMERGESKEEGEKDKDIEAEKAEEGVKSEEKGESVFGKLRRPQIVVVVETAVAESEECLEGYPFFRQAVDGRGQGEDEKAEREKSVGEEAGVKGEEAGEKPKKRLWEIGRRCVVFDEEQLVEVAEGRPMKMPWKEEEYMWPVDVFTPSSGMVPAMRILVLLTSEIETDEEVDEEERGVEEEAPRRVMLARESVTVYDKLEKVRRREENVESGREKREEYEVVSVVDGPSFRRKTMKMVPLSHTVRMQVAVMRGASKC